MSRLLKTYIMTIKTLTPVHIGTGVVLVNNFDFVVHGGKTYRLNVDHVLDYLWPADVDALSKGDMEKLMRTPPGEQLKKPADLQHPDLVMYVMDGEPRVKDRDAGQIREQIKDVYGRLYIPGSTIKGAIRTALARHLAKKVLNVGAYSFIPTEGKGGKEAKREKAGDELERKLFRPGQDSANYDLLRA
ncbi:MAG: type III-A CRISPR-associated RAMP protein Csm5, partial [Anaerolineae bacterium]